MNTDPRSTAMNAELTDDIIPDYFDPVLEPEFLSVETSSELLEHEMLSTFLSIMRSGQRDSDRRAAAGDVAEILGRKGKSAVQFIKAENLQLNQLNQIDAKPEMKAHLIEAAKGLAAITAGHSSGVKSKQGGQGV